MGTRAIQQKLKAMEVTEGAGVSVFRTIGTPQLRNLDPFLMLDFFCSNDPDDYIAGFPDHPHRGFITFTYMLDGHMLHRDSMGNEGDLRSGAAQWMKAASGVIHSEMPKQSEGLMRGFQLWINLPASEKMSSPGYQEYAPDAFPVVKQDGASIKALVGHFDGVDAPIQDQNTNVLYLDISIEPGKQFKHTLDDELSGFVYVFEGDAVSGNTDLPEQTFAVLGEGDEVVVTAQEKPVRLILVVGRPIGEPIAQYGPFVMNSPEEIHQAMADYRDGVLVREKAQMVGT
ncbi:MAG: pirin family protein [Gammaproteobacteria bacterium]|nr:pirin family protein [Gammaproteobacteria bacterium]